MIRRFTALGVARLVAAAVQAIALIVVARFVAVSTFGELTVVLAILGFGFVAASAGLPQFILRERALGDDGAVQSGLRANVLTTVASGALLIVAAFTLLRGELLVAGVALVVAVGVDKTVDCQLSVPIADRRLRPVVVSIVGRATVLATVFLGAILLYGPEGALVSYVLARSVAALFAVAHILMVRVRVDAAPLGLRELTRRVWPLAGANLVSALRSLDSAIVFVAAGSDVAGLYSAASRPFAPASIVAASAGAVLMPHSATADWATLRHQLRRLRAIALVTTALLVPLAFLGPTVAVLIYGPRYEAAGVALGICLVVVPAVVSAAVVSTVLQSRGLERYVLVNSVVFLAVFVVAVSGGSLLAGATGAAIGFAVSVWSRNAGLAWGVRLLRNREEIT